MNWLDPGASAIRGLRGKVRTVGDPPRRERESAKQKRHRIATKKPSRAAYFRDYNRRPERRAYLNAKRRQYRAEMRSTQGDTRA